jgi:hypothetical protein
MRKKVLRMTKTVKVLKISEILDDLLADIADEDLLKKYKLTWVQLEKVYNKLLYSGFLSRTLLKRRVELRDGKSASHIPLAEIDASGRLYECGFCGFRSRLHFSACPKCRNVNLRRLSRLALIQNSINAAGAP